MPLVEMMGMIDELAEGETWEDEIPITMTRGQWNVLFTITMMQMRKLIKAVEECEEDARGGDVSAILIYPHLRESMDLVKEVFEKIGIAVAPQMMEDIAKRVADEVAKKMKKDG